MKLSANHAKRMLLFCSLAAASLAWCAVAAKAKRGWSPGSPSVFAADKGKFDIRQDGQSVGHEEFEISQTADRWVAHGTDEWKPAGGRATRVTGTLTLQPDGAPISYEWSSQADTKNGANISFTNGAVRIVLQMEGARPFEQNMSFNTPLIAVLDNNLYYQYAVLARVYDWAKRGAQTFPVLIPQELTPGTITVEASGSVTAEGKPYEGLRVATSDLEVVLYLDSHHRLMRLEVPSAKVSVTRQ